METVKITITSDKRNKGKPYIVRWYGDYDFDTGKEKRYQKSFRLKSEAEIFAAQKRVELAEGEQEKPREIILRRYCREFRSIKKSQVRPGSILVYDNTIRRLLDFFDPNTPLRQITAQAAARFTASQKPYGKNEQLSNYSIHRVVRNCRTMFAVAVEWGYVEINPFKAVTRPKCIGRPWHYLTPDEYLRLLDVVPLRWQGFYALAYTAGLRLGAILNLTWNDVDLNKGEVRIQNRPATAILPPFFVKDADARTVPIPRHTCNILSSLYEQRPKGVPYVVLTGREHHTVRDKWQRYRKENRSWANRDMQNNTLTTFKRHIRKAGITPDGTLAIHTLRKSCITNWAKDPALTPKTVQLLAGHSDLATTMRYYVQVDQEQRTKATAGIDRLLEK